MYCVHDRLWPWQLVQYRKHSWNYKPHALSHDSCVNLSTRDISLLLARLLGQYCFACWRLSASVVVVCTTAGRRAVGRAGGRAADTAQRASRVTSRQGDTLFPEVWELERFQIAKVTLNVTQGHWLVLVPFDKPHIGLRFSISKNLLCPREGLRSIVMSAYVCVCVCVSLSVSVCLPICTRACLPNRTRYLYQILCMLPIAVARSSDVPLIF